jgi:hypothetical protein
VRRFPQRVQQSGAAARGSFGDSALFNKAGASVGELSDAIAKLREAGVPIDRGIQDAVLTRLEQEALQTSTRDQEGRLELAEGRRWIENPTVTGVAAYSYELISAAEEAHGHLQTELSCSNLPSLDGFIKSRAYSVKFATLTSTFLVEATFSNPTRWYRKELPRENRFKRAAVVNWFKRNLKGCRFSSYSTPDSGLWFSRRATPSATPPTNPVAWVGSGLKPLAAGVAEEASTAAFKTIFKA